MKTKTSWTRPKTTKAEAAEIAKLYASGEKVETIVQRFNRNKSTIRRVVVRAGLQLREQHRPKGYPWRRKQPTPSQSTGSTT